MDSRAYVVGLVGAYRQALLVQYAFASGLFTMCNHPRTIDEVASATGWIPHKTKWVLDTLVTLQLLYRHHDQYLNNTNATRFLNPIGAEYVGDLVMHEWLQRSLWSDLTRVCRTTSPLQEQEEIVIAYDPERNRIFQRAMRQIAGDLPTRIAALPEWRRCQCVLDVAGGHGLYLAAITQAYPHIHGIVLDQPPSRSAAEAIFHEFGLTTRLEFDVCDITASHPLAKWQADGILICNCLHNFAAETICNILSSARQVLAAGGVLVIVETDLEENRPLPVESAIFGAYMAVNCVNGWLPPRSWLKREIEEIGFTVREECLRGTDVALIGTIGAVA